jgi:peptidoglycan-associated lipoprotein
MGKRTLVISVLLIGAIVLFGGCSKKVTKTEETLSKPQDKPKTEQQVQTAKQDEIVPTDSFKIQDPDAKTKEILLPIYFMYDKYDLLPESVTKLGKIAPFLQNNATMRILIEGNADERGSNEYNMGLGESRARTVKNYLISFGIPEKRLEMTSYGKEKPAVPNCGAEDEACHAKNRRVEWKVLAK